MVGIFGLRKRLVRILSGLVSAMLVVLCLLPAQPRVEAAGLCIGATAMIAGTGGEGLKLRSGPSSSSNAIGKNADGTIVTVVGGPRNADGYTWWQIKSPIGTGWSAGAWLRLTSPEQPVTKPPAQAKPPLAPTILEPGKTSLTVAGSCIRTLTPTLTWQPAQGATDATRYSVTISEYPYGSANIRYSQDSLTGKSTSVPPGVLQWEKKYRWNMQAYSSGVWSSVSNTLYLWTYQDNAEIARMLVDAAIRHGVPPVLLKAIAYHESTQGSRGWNQYGTDGSPLVHNNDSSVDVGIMQINVPSRNSSDYRRVANSVLANIDAGARRLAEKWKMSQATGEKDDPRLIENWWHATLFYQSGTREYDNRSSYGEKVRKIMTQPPSDISSYTQSFNWTFPTDLYPGFLKEDSFTVVGSGQNGVFKFFTLGKKRQTPPLEVKASVHDWTLLPTQ